MNTDERSMIEGLFQRLQQAETQAGARDPQAAELINGLIARQPAAPYFLAQIVLVQEHGLRNLQTRIEELEQELAARPKGDSGFLGGLFGSRPQAAPQPPAAAPARPATGGWANSGVPAQGAVPMQPGAGGGGFMAGAMQTAVGVAGGVLLGSAVAGLFADDAKAEEKPAEPAPAAEPEEAPAEDGGGFFSDFFGGGDEESF